MAKLVEFAGRDACFDDGSTLPIPEGYDGFYKNGQYRFMPRPGVYPRGANRRVGALVENAPLEAVQELFNYLQGSA